MTIKATSFIPDQDEAKMPMTLGLTMSVAEWRELMKAMPADASLAGQLGNIISRSIGSSIAKLTVRYDLSAWHERVEAARGIVEDSL